MVDEEFGALAVAEADVAHAERGFVEHYAGGLPAPAGIGEDEVEGVAAGSHEAVGALLAHEPQVAVGELLAQAQRDAEGGLARQRGGVGAEAERVGAAPCVGVDGLKLVVGHGGHGPALAARHRCGQGRRGYEYYMYARAHV